MCSVQRLSISISGGKRENALSFRHNNHIITVGWTHLFVCFCYMASTACIKCINAFSFVLLYFFQRLLHAVSKRLFTIFIHKLHLHSHFYISHILIYLNQNSDSTPTRATLWCVSSIHLLAAAAASAVAAGTHRQMFNVFIYIFNRGTLYIGNWYYTDITDTSDANGLGHIHTLYGYEYHSFMSSNEDACQNRKEETVSITHETLKVKYSLKICAYLIYDYHFVVSFTFIQYI